jgi:hypothetical protein
MSLRVITHGDSSKETSPFFSSEAIRSQSPYRYPITAFPQLDEPSSECKEKPRLIDDRRCTQGNRFATDDGTANKETAGLIDSPSGL